MDCDVGNLFITSLLPLLLFPNKIPPQEVILVVVAGDRKGIGCCPDGVVLQVILFPGGGHHLGPFHSIFTRDFIMSFAYGPIPIRCPSFRWTAITGNFSIFPFSEVFRVFG